MTKIDKAISPGGFGDTEEALKIFSAGLAEEFEEKQRECRLEEEEALLRLSEMEKETLKQVADEWKLKEEVLSGLSLEVEDEIRTLKEKFAGKLVDPYRMGALLEEAFALLLGEEDQ